MVPGDSQSHPFFIKMLLVGVADPGAAVARRGGQVNSVDALNQVRLSATTEPLPPGTTARLVASDKPIDLIPLEYTEAKLVLGWQSTAWGSLANDTDTGWRSPPGGTWRAIRVQRSPRCERSGPAPVDRGRLRDRRWTRREARRCIDGIACRRSPVRVRRW